MIGRLAREERGGVTAWVVIWVPVLILMATFVIDVGNWWTHRRHLQSQVDSGALAAGASYALPLCQSDVPTEDGIADEARVYSGVSALAAGDTRKYNPQVSNSANVHVVVNSVNFWNQGGTDYSDGGGPCFDHPSGGPGATSGASSGFWTDVKATEVNLPWLIPFAGKIVPRINARARVAVKKAIIFTRAMPFAVPDVNPTHAKATLIDECTGTPLPGGDLTLAHPSPAQDDIWTATTASAVTFPGASGSCTGANARNGRVGVRVLMSSGTNTSCGQALVECYDSGSANGIYAVRVWSLPAQTDPGAWSAPSAPTTTFLPYVTNVELDTNPACFGYFTATNCGATIAVTMVRGTGANSFAVGVFNTLEAVYPGGNVDLTDPDNDGIYTNSTPIPLSTGGPYPITINWDWRLRSNTETWRGLTCTNGGNNPCEVTGQTFGLVHRGFRSSSARSGPVQNIQLRAFSNPPTGLIESVQAGFSDRVTVTIRTMGTLRPQSSPTDPLVTLRAFDGSQTQAIDCMPNVNLHDEIAFGCTKFYALNDGSDPNWNPCPQPDSVGEPEPWKCVPTQTGGSIGQFGDGLGIRLGNQSACNNVNHWPEVGSGSDTDPLTNVADPRAVKLYLVPFGAFGGSGNQNYPIINVGLFYITGFGAPGSNRDRCGPADGEDPAADGDLVGHFFKRVGVNDDELIPNDEPCAPNTVTPCVAVLVD